jgi:hypothetical protein
MAFTTEQIERAKQGTHWVSLKRGEPREECRVVDIKAVCAYVRPVNRPIFQPVRLDGTTSFCLVVEDDYRTP